MAIELRQQLKLTQQLIMTPQLQMAIKLLQLSRLELIDVIRQEMVENPTLEEVQETPESHAEERSEEAAAPETDKMKEVVVQEKMNDDVDWSNYIDEYNSPGKTYYESEEKESPRFEAFIAQKESLNDHLMWQFRMTFPEQEQERIGGLIIGNLNKDGYLDVSAEELAVTTGSSVEEVEAVLAQMQAFDPPGICARDIRECLLIQANILGLNDPVVLSIISDHLKNLENKNYKAIAKALKISMEEVGQAVRVIQGLEPRPGRIFSDEDPIYITPDIYVYKYEDDFVIMLNDDGMPKLRISNLYKTAFTDPGKISGQAKDYIQDKMRSAAWLIRSIHQRQKTIYKVMESIVKFQRDFFEKGIAHLKPMVLRDVAQDIGMHESTISRVTTNKYAFTPQGIFELKYFFNSSISRSDGGEVASASVLEKIRRIIEGEDPKKPYSDSKITKILNEANINIARRTVAKYREALGALPSNKRKQI